MSSVPTTKSRTFPLDAYGINLAVTAYEAPHADAPELVLIHGIGSRGVSWYPVIDDLARTFRVFTYDLRGHGDSAKPDQGYLLPDYALDLDGLLAGLEIESPRLLGHSLGGLTALRWAADNPNRAAAIALEDTALSGGPSLRPAFEGWLALSRMTVEQAAAWYAAEYPDWSEDDCLRRAESITSVHPRVFEELRDESTASDRPPRLLGVEKITSPLLLIHGDTALGGMVPPAAAARLAQMIPGMRVTHIPGVGHTVHRDARDAFLAAAVPFLAEQSG